MRSRIYAIDSEHEAERLEAQAVLAGIDRHLRHVPVPPGARVLDVACGSGAMARRLAAAHPSAFVVGVDVRHPFVAFAVARAAEEGLSNVAFHTADLFRLPYADGSFDVVWTKYVLQWLADQRAALAELQRVLAPGGLLVSADFDGFMVEHFPVDTEFAQKARWLFPQFVDTEVGRKVAGHLLELGFVDVDAVVERDEVFTVIGPIDAERRRNWEVQWRAMWPRVVDLLGSETAAEALRRAFFAHHDDPRTTTTTSLYVTRGRRPLAATRSD